MPTSCHRGFTLIELMIALLVAAILASLAVPSFGSFVANQERRSALYNLKGLLTLARQHAVMNGALVTVCPLDDKNRCGKNWNGQIHAFMDPLNAKQLNNNNSLIRTLPSTQGLVTVRSLNRSFFQFTPTGLVYSDLGNITWCPESGDASLAGQLIINRGGQIRFAQDKNKDGTPEDSKGRDLRC